MVRQYEVIEVNVLKSEANDHFVLTLFLLEICRLKVYVTGYWKTDHNVTLGQLHFIGPANSHTHALSMH